MFILLIYLLATLGIIVSFFKNKTKTKKSLIKSWKAFENILPQFLSILLIIGIVLTVLEVETIQKYIGLKSGVVGVILSATIGAITLIPGFIAFPLAAALLKSGAGVSQIAAFVSSLMMVGVVTLPLEIKTFGKKIAIIRNLAGFLFSILLAFFMGVLI